MSRVRAPLCVLIVAAVAALCVAQNPRPGRASTAHTAEVKSVTVVGNNDGPVLAISTSRPLTPKLQVVEGPLRLVIDLSGLMDSSVRKRIPFRDEQIKDIRVNQYQSDPPVTRIVVDLAGPVRYTWDALGNRLNIRIRPDEAATAKPESVPVLSAGAQPIAVPYAEGSGGTLVEAGSRVSSGSSITAKEETAILRLARGGEVKVCPGTTVSVATSQSGKDLLLGMSTGAMETHYRLEESSDSILTPDFRIVLPGPGEFDFAISADAHGNTCVNSMAGTSSSVVVAELLDSGTYEIKPEQQVMFRQGRLDTIEHPEGNCGCPARQEPVLRTANDSGALVPEEKAPSKLQLENSADPPGSAVAENPTAANSGLGTSSAQGKETEMKVQLEAPLVFSGRDRPKRPEVAPDAPVQQAAALPLSSRTSDPLPAVVVLPPVEPKSKNKGFFGHLRGVLGSIFR